MVLRLFYLAIVFKLYNVFNECNYWFFFKDDAITSQILFEPTTPLIDEIDVGNWVIDDIEESKDFKPTHHLLMLNKHVSLKRNKI
jgi:hypothetical protein